MTRTPRRIGALVAAGILAVTVILAWLAWRVEVDAQRNLLDRQVEQAATVLSGGVSLLAVQLADAGEIATATEGAAGPFQRFAAARLAPDGSFASLSLLRVGDGPAELLATAGEQSRLPDGGLASPFLDEVPPTGQLAVGGILPGEPARLAFALRPEGDTSGLVVYAETVVSPEPQPTNPDDVAFGGLDFAVYLGETTAADQLLLSTAPAPIGGDTESATLPFGDTTLTVVGAAPGSLTSALATALPWIVLGVGSVLAVVGGLGVSALTRRRSVAERLAAENDELYREQRGIAGTLQRSLLPTLPTLHGVETAARYEAGEDSLSVGGDWYDVIEVGPGCCVFVVGDVSGHGLPAATTMAALRFAVRGFLAEGHDITTVLTQLRRLLDVDTDHQFATVLLGQLDTSAGRLRMVAAGHFAPLLVTAGGAELLECPPEPPVGVAYTGPARVTELTVKGPATLVAFTDGLIERRGEAIDDGLDRLRAAGARFVERPLTDMLDDVLNTLANDGMKDDTVLLGLRWTR